MSSWIGKYTWNGEQPYRIDWIRDGKAGLSEYDNESRVKTVEVEEVRMVMNLNQLARSVKDYKQRFPARTTYICPQEQISRWLDDGTLTEEDDRVLKELYGYGSHFGDEERIPEDVWRMMHADHVAVLKDKAHHAKLKKTADAEAAKKMH